MKISKNIYRCREPSMFLLMWKCPGLRNTVQVLRKVPFHSACRNRLKTVHIHSMAWLPRAAEPPLGLLRWRTFEVFTHLLNRITKVIRRRLGMWLIFVHICFLSSLSANRTAFQSHPLWRSWAEVGVTAQTDLIPPRFSCTVFITTVKTCFHLCSYCAGDQQVGIPACTGRQRCLYLPSPGAM